MANCKAVFVIFLTLLILLTLITLDLRTANATEKTIVVPQDYDTINAAIAHASMGDTIFVKKGIYKENVVINKPLSLQGEEKTSIIDGGDKGTVVWVNAENVSMSDFTIQNSGNNFTDSGIYLNNSLGSSFSNNSIINNNIGVYILESSNSQLKDNALSSNKFNFGIYSSNLAGYIQDIGISNTVDGKPIIYWVNQSGKQVPKDSGYVAAINCTDIKVSGASLQKNWQNILIAYSKNSTVTNTTSILGEDSVWLIETTNCTVTGNNISDNIWGGIALVNSSGCIIKNNTFQSNGGYGIFLSDSSNNQFYHNNLIDNPRQSWLYGNNANLWDNGYPSGGNYWSNYNGADVKEGALQNITGSDGIVDKPFVMDSNNKDNYPLMKMWTAGTSEIQEIPIEFSMMAIVTIVSGILIGLLYLVKVHRAKTNSEKDVSPLG